MIITPPVLDKYECVCSSDIVYNRLLLKKDAMGISKILFAILSLE